MEEIQNNPTNLCEDVLAHHGILGMKWGVRRYQPYPDNYSGDGKFVGKKSVRAERRQARHVAKTNTRIKNAVDTGNKKKLKKYKDEMSPEEYEKKYAETVKNGIDNAVKDRDKSALKKYKEDLNKREYQHQKDRIEFKDAIDNDNSHKTKKLLSKVDPEDVTEATNLIRSRVALQDQKLSKIRQDSELMARMDKLASGLGKVSKISQNVSNITSSFMNVNKSMTDFANAQKDEKEKKKIEKIVKSGDVELIEKHKNELNLTQLKEAYDRAYVENQAKVDDAIKTGDVDTIRKLVPYIDNKAMSGAIAKVKSLDGMKSKNPTIEEAKNSPTVQIVSDWIEGSSYFQQASNTRASDMTNYLSRAPFAGFEIRHSDIESDTYDFIEGILNNSK